MTTPWIIPFLANDAVDDPSGMRRRAVRINEVSVTCPIISCAFEPASTFLKESSPTLRVRPGRIQIGAEMMGIGSYQSRALENASPSRRRLTLPAR
jgi:hypothetical protein